MTGSDAAIDPRRRGWLWATLQLIFQNLVVFGLRFRISGRERLPASGALLLINHQSSLDPLVVAVALRRPVSYLARHTLFEIPLIGWLLRRTYVMPIHRDTAGTESIRKAVGRLDQGYYVGMFPEGTRSLDGELQPIKPGFLAIVRRAAVPVIPIGVAGANRAYPRGAWVLRPRTVRVVVGLPFSADEARALSEKQRQAEFMAEVQARLQDCLDRANAWIEGEPAEVLEEGIGSSATNLL